jgi:hypothetical protein
MTESVGLSFDPRCPWCYQTARWALRLEELGALDLSWSVFCLELHNFEGDRDDFEPAKSKSGPALRTSVVVRDSLGQAACGRFYAAIGRRYFIGLEDLSLEATIRGALDDAALAPEFYDQALSDWSSWDTVVADHERVAQESGGFGVPFFRLDAGKGPAMFGPVIKEVPSDDEALTLLSHVVWLIRNANFYELKSGRSQYPDLPHIKKALAGRRT